MADAAPITTEPASDDTDNSRAEGDSRLPLFLWIGLTLAFIAYLTFGSVNARFWQFGDLRIESRSIARTWRVQAESLHRVAHQWMLEALFYGAILIFIAGVIIGIRLLLVPEEREHPGGDAS